MYCKHAGSQVSPLLSCFTFFFHCCSLIAPSGLHISLYVVQSECTVSEESSLQTSSTPSGCGVFALHEVEDRLLVCIQVKCLF